MRFWDDIVISNTFRLFKIDTKCHLVNIWSDLDLVKLRDWYINNNKKTWSAHIYFSNNVLFFLTCMCKHIFGKIFFCALHVFLCARVLRPVCARTCAQLRGNIAREYLWLYVWYISAPTNPSPTPWFFSGLPRDVARKNSWVFRFYGFELNLFVFSYIYVTDFVGFEPVHTS